MSTANIARTALIPAFKRAGNAEVYGIASCSGKAAEAAEALQIPKSYTSYEDMLNDPDIDAVYIPLPNSLHKQWTIEAARRGKHVLVEKPAALTSSETREMADFCRAKQVKFMEAFMYQFHPQHERVRQLIASGEIGEVKLMRASFSFYLGSRENNIRTNREQGGGSLYDVGCYAVHAIRNILQSEPAEVDVKADIDPVYQVDMSAFGHMKMKNGVHAQFDCSFDMVERTEYEVIGTKGHIIVHRPFRPDKHGGEGLITIRTADGSREERVSGDIYRAEVEHISQAILDDSEPSYTAENAIQNMKVIEACYESIHSGRPVALT